MSTQTLRACEILSEFIQDEELDITWDDDGRTLVVCPHCEPWPAELQYGCIACNGAGSTPLLEAVTKGLVMSTDPDAPRYFPPVDTVAALAKVLILIEQGERDVGLALRGILDMIT